MPYLTVALQNAARAALNVVVALPNDIVDVLHSTPEPRKGNDAVLNAARALRNGNDHVPKGDDDVRKGIDAPPKGNDDVRNVTGDVPNGIDDVPNVIDDVRNGIVPLQKQNDAPPRLKLKSRRRKCCYYQGLGELGGL